MSTEGSYDDWATIDYRPAITDLLPGTLLPLLSPSAIALDVGCNRGNVDIFLGEHGVTVVGIDISERAITAARERASKDACFDRVRFLRADFLSWDSPQSFDLILMIRFLTCLPRVEQFERALTLAYQHLSIGGLLYIHDFVYSPELTAYRQRYRDAEVRGWRLGNFAVNSHEGNTLFIAHHHLKAEMDHIVRPYEGLHFAEHDSLSMNGNTCRMFEFIGRKSSHIYPDAVRPDLRSGKHSGGER
jgi:SAM-dependent methyltransferase